MKLMDKELQAKLESLANIDEAVSKNFVNVVRLSDNLTTQFHNVLNTNGTCEGTIKNLTGICAGLLHLVKFRNVEISSYLNKGDADPAITKSLDDFRSSEEIRNENK